MLMEAYNGIVGQRSQQAGDLIVAKDLIVVVDDHEDSFLLLNFILNDLCDGQVVGLANGQAILEQAAALQPSLILLDIILPDIDGVEVMQRLRQDPLMQEVPIVAVTALANQQDRDRLLQAGFTDYISKPYLLEDIATLLERYLRKK